MRAVIGATVVAAIVGAIIGTLLASDEPAPAPAAKPKPRIGLQSGFARIPLPSGWEPLGRRSSLPGLEQATAVRGAHAQVALDIRPPEDASLLPAAFAGGAPGGLPDPSTRRLGRRTVWRYDLAGPRPEVRVIALALPTTGGVLTVACEAGIGAVREAGADCERATAAVQLDGAAALAPAPETAAAIVLPSTAARLNRIRGIERRRLAATRSPRLRAGAAARLARAYADAAARLRPLAAGDVVPLVAALDALARRHRVLAAASRQRRARKARRAGAAIERGERRLGPRLAAVTEPAGR